MGEAAKGDLKQEIFNEVNENIKALERLFPSAVKDGQVDFQALKEELGQFEEVGPEKYGLTWSGKQNAKKKSQEDVIGKTLKYIPEESKNPETTENLYIEGDNLEVLKLLRQNYYKSIKMIYIDPPYNTGNDFVYNDNYNMGKSESDKAEGDMSESGERYTINPKSSNRYHARWLNNMYPRLKVAKDLLSDDGVIFISIDDNEVSNLKEICDEIFGEENFVTNFIWKKRNSLQYEEPLVTSQTEYILCYAKIKSIFNYHEGSKFSRIKKPYDGINYKNPDNDPRGPWLSSGKERNDGRQIYEVTSPTGVKFKGAWIPSPSEFDKWDKAGLIWWGKNGDSKPRKKSFLKDFKGNVSSNLLMDEFTLSKDFKNKEKIWTIGTTESGTKELSLLLGNTVFDYPKPISLIKYLVNLINDKNAIVLDFFSGSSTTAHAVMQLNAEDRGKRKYFMIQFPEETKEKSDGRKNGYYNICDIAKERIKRAGEKIKEENKDKEGIEDLDIGFKVFRVSDTNIRWNYESENLNTLSKDAESNISVNDTTFDYIAATKEITLEEGAMSPKDALDFMPGFKDIDVVYEILLRQRDIPLSAKVELLEDIGKRTYIFADSYLVCLEENITVEIIEKLAALNPLPIKFILRDSAFGDDIALKDETYRRLNILIERNLGETKKSYTVEFI